MEVLHRTSATYVAQGDGQTRFLVPAGTETVEQVIVAGRKLNPGTDYTVEFLHRQHFSPLSFTLQVAPQKGDNIHIQGIVWKQGKGRRR